MKSITIAGNCTKDAEMRTTQSGQSVAGFSIAVNGYSNGQKTTDYFDVSVWGKRGEAVMQFAKKGAKMCATGDLSTYESNGKTYLKVNASDFTPMGGSQQSQGGYDSGSQGGGYGAGGQPGSSGGGFNLDEDDVPFAACVLI